MIKNKRKLLTSVIVFVIVLSFLLPTTYHVSAYNENEIKVTDSAGDIKIIKKPVERIVVLNPDAAQAVRVLGKEDKIVGIEASIEVQPTLFSDLSKLPSVGIAAPMMINIEAIKQLHPDLVIAYAPGIYNPGYNDLEAKLEPDIQVIRLNLYALPSLKDEMKTLGRILDAEKEADEYIRWCDGWMNKIDYNLKDVPNHEKTKVYMEMGTLPPSFVKGMSTFQILGRFAFNGDNIVTGDVFDMIKVKNIADDLSSLKFYNIGGEPIEIMKGYSTVDPEWIVKKDPEMIIGGALGFNMRVGGYETDNPAERDVKLFYMDKYLGDVPPAMIALGNFMLSPDGISINSYYDEIINLKGLKYTTAFKNGQIHVIHHTIACGPASPVAMAYYAKWAHPDEMKDIDPEVIHQEYIDKFMQIDFDVKNHGAFVYPKVS
ncbi:MAG TPA: ABC transporter substrate-binding protein [Halobacteria archaeon]|jgi:iron complex transport system substrate-binding protein|nr:ABC transporter substrate-binding protein [Halobacteria archaeon]